MDNEWGKWKIRLNGPGQKERGPGSRWRACVYFEYTYIIKGSRSMRRRNKKQFLQNSAFIRGTLTIKQPNILYHPLGSVSVFLACKVKLVT